MNKKLFYAALALPMMFAACSQEELFVENNGGMVTPEAQGIKLDLVTTKGDVVDATRADWHGNGLTWISTDQISVYWLGAQTGEPVYNGQFNSVYKTDEAGVNFSSESLIYEGGNVAVFPADLKHTSSKAIAIAVPAEQGKGVENNTPYISNRLNVNVREWGKNQHAGYDKALYAPMKQAANVVTFDFTLKNTADLLADPSFGFAVESVELVANANAFATTAAIVNGNRQVYGKDGKPVKDSYSTEPNDKGTEETTIDKVKYTYDAVSSILEVSASATTTTLKATYVEKVDEAKGLYRATFVVLPTDVATLSETSMIRINTTCGHIDLKTKELEADGKTWTAKASLSTNPDPEDKEWKAPANSGAITNTKTGEVLAIADQFEKIASYRRNESASSKFLGEKAGRTYMLSFEADMSTATLDESVVYTSEDIERYVQIHTAMKSVEKMGLILSTKAKDAHAFVLTQAAVNAVNSRNVVKDKPYNALVTLSFGDKINGIQLTGGGNVYLDNAHNEMFESAFDLTLDNSAAAWTMNDTYSNVKVSNIINNGTLTVSGTTNKAGDKQQLTTLVVNNGTFNIGGEFLRVSDKLTNNKTVNVAKNQDLRFNVNAEIGGTIEVAAGAFLTVEKDVELTSKAIINNSGIVSSIAGAGGINNAGTINVKEDKAITYLQDNTNGTINLKNRNDEVKVELGKGKIVYNYTSEDEEVFAYNTEDKFTMVIFGGDTEELVIKKNFSDIDMVFNGETTLSASGSATVRDLTVGAKAHLMFLTPSGAYQNVLNVRNITNSGNITIGGTIYYNNTFVDNGTVRSVGSGAIVKSTLSVSDESSLKANLAKGYDVKLGANINLSEVLSITEDVTIDLNGKTVTAAGDAFEVTNGTLTITGNGTVAAGQGGTFVAVWANGGNVVIENGSFSVGTDAKGKCNDCIYAKGGTITINGGTYTHAGTDSTDGGAVVNAHNSVPNSKVIVNGGTFTGHQIKEEGDITAGRVVWNIK